MFNNKKIVITSIASVMICVSCAMLVSAAGTLQKGKEYLQTRMFLAQCYTSVCEQTKIPKIAEEAVYTSSVMDIAIQAITGNQDVELTSAYEYASIGDWEISERVAAYQKKLEEERAKEAARKSAQASAAVASQMASRPGMVGRLTIPSLGINVALFASNSQAVVDAADSAAYFGFGGATIIGDHWNQGFSAIRSAYPGMVAYIDDGTSKRTLTCTGVMTGTNTGYDLLDASGVSVSARGGYVMYTCNGSNWQSVTLAFFS